MIGYAREGEERGKGIPLSTIERVMRHYNIDQATAENYLSVHPVEMLLPERGYGLTEAQPNSEWTVAAEGVSLTELAQVIADMELPKGTKMKVIMDLKFPLGWAFDIAGAELIFKPFIPEGVSVADVYGEGSTGIVELDIDPIRLAAILAFIKAHWLAITIAGLALTFLITFMVVMVKVPAAAAIPIAFIIGTAAGVVGLMAVGIYAAGKRQRI